MKHLTVDQAAARFLEVDPIATGAKLRGKRREFCFTLEGLAEVFERAYCPVSINSIGKWERGICFPRLDHLFFLACLYSCSLDELVVSSKESVDSEPHDQPVPFLFTLSWRTQYCVRFYVALVIAVFTMFGPVRAQVKSPLVISAGR